MTLSNRVLNRPTLPALEGSQSRRIVSPSWQGQVKGVAAPRGKQLANCDSNEGAGECLSGF